MPNGAKTADVCREHGISSATLGAWKAKFGGMEPSEANPKLKRLLAEAMFDNTALRDLLSERRSRRAIVRQRSEDDSEREA